MAMNRQKRDSPACDGERRTAFASCRSVFCEFGTGPIICLALPFLLAGDLTEMSKEAMTQDRSERG